MFCQHEALDNWLAASLIASTMQQPHGHRQITCTGLKPPMLLPWVLPWRPRQAPGWCLHTHHLQPRGCSLPGQKGSRQMTGLPYKSLQPVPPPPPCLAVVHTMPGQQYHFKSNGCFSGFCWAPGCSGPPVPSQLHPLPRSPLPKVQLVPTGCPASSLALFKSGSCPTAAQPSFQLRCLPSHLSAYQPGANRSTTGTWASHRQHAEAGA